MTPEESMSFSSRWEAAWQLTRLISPRPEVHKAARDAYGEPVNEYTLAHGVGPVVPMTPWLVHLADLEDRFWLLPFDFDVVPGHTDGVEQAQDHADALSILLGQLSIAHVVCESSSKGGRHVWIGMAEPAPADLVDAIGKAAKAVLPALDRGMLSNPRRGGARPPLSPHRNGSFSRVLRGTLDSLVMPSTTTDDLRALLAALLERAPAQDPEETVIAGEIRPVAFIGRRRLSVKAQAKLQVHRGGDDPSRTAWHALLVLASNGFSYDEVVAAVADAPSFEHFRTRRAGDRGERRPRTAAETAARLEDAWEKVQRHVRVRRSAPSSEPKDLATLQQQVAISEDLALRFRVNPGRWGGRYGGPTRRTVLTGLAYLMLRTGKTAVAASTRTLAELCNIDHSTAARALQDLRQEGLVERTEAAEGLNAATWSLAPLGDFSTGSDLGATQPLDITPRPPADSERVGVLYAQRATLLERFESFLAALQHDVFTYAGLGHQAGQIWALMREGAAWTVEAVARVFQISFERAAALLSKLRRVKLVRPTQEGWSAGRRDLRGSAAEKLGVLGVLKARIQQHEDDRMLWRWWRAEYDKMTSPTKRRPKRRHVTDRPLEWGTAVEQDGELDWPMYPRRGDDPRQPGDHRRARFSVEAGHLRPARRKQGVYFDAA
ncbi:helix-turn-helix domain-containing protein [Leifsonia sp. McL0607]|uniref:helix-turn-helix domain-containing protein n=1 Tax=Leifsonia sp. McL0607 TaxID=3415672 RepID=UPI003CF67DAE